MSISEFYLSQCIFCLSTFRCKCFYISFSVLLLTLCQILNLYKEAKLNIWKKFVSVKRSIFRNFWNCFAENTLYNFWFHVCNRMVGMTCNSYCICVAMTVYRLSVWISMFSNFHSLLWETQWSFYLVLIVIIKYL